MKKVRKKSRKNLEVKKKCVSLQSLSETGERMRDERAREGHWKIIDKADRSKNKESTTKYRERLTRALIPSRNEQQSGSGERYNYTMKSLILAQDER